MSRSRYCQECSCWGYYPNKSRQRKNGQWPCIQYVNINQHEGYKKKTHCIRKDVIFGFIKEKDNGK